MYSNKNDIESHSPNFKKYTSDPYKQYNQFGNPPPRYGNQYPQPQERYQDPHIPRNTNPMYDPRTLGSNQNQNMLDPPSFVSNPLSSKSRSRSHSKDIQAQQYNYPNQNRPRTKSIERDNQNDPLYFRDPFPVPMPSNPYNQQPNYYDRPKKAGNRNPPPYNEEPNYGYEKKMTANFNNVKSNSIHDEDYRKNDYNYSGRKFNMEVGSPYRDKPEMVDERRNHDSRNSFRKSRSRGEPFVDYPEFGFEKLFVANSITMKPHFSVKEYSNDFELYYYIYPGDISGKNKNITIPPLFIISYKHSCCSKYCLTGDCRATDIMIRHPTGKEFLRLTRECNCTCLCSHRPQLFVQYVEEGSEHQAFNLGTIYNPFVCCDYELHITLDNGTPKYIINSDCCSCNMYCCFNCDTCNKTTMKICDSAYNQMSKIQMITNFDCCRPNIDENDSYILDFPPFTTKEDRALLLASLIFLDFRYMTNNLPSS